MTLSKLTRREEEQREAFFNRPSTVRDVIGSRTVIDATRDSVLEAVARCAEDPDNHAVLIQGGLLPENVQPHEEWELALEPWRVFLKYGEEVNLRVPRSIKEALAQQTSEVKLRREKFAGLDESVDYCGLVWTGIRTRTKRKVHLVDAIEGVKLFVYADTRHKRSPDRIDVNAYADTKTAPTQGAFYVVEVPSRSRTTPYLFRLQSVPLPNSEQRHVVWTDEHAYGHGCEENLYYFSYRRRTGEQVFCPHVVAAHMAVAKQEKKRGFMDMPFPLPTPFLVEKVYNILRGRTMVLEEVTEKEKTRKIKRPLNKGEVELVLWKAIAHYGHDRTCYVNTDHRRGPVDPRMQEYRWQIS